MGRSYCQRLLEWLLLLCCTKVPKSLLSELSTIIPVLTIPWCILDIYMRSYVLLEVLRGAEKGEKFQLEMTLNVNCQNECGRNIRWDFVWNGAIK